MKKEQKQSYVYVVSLEWVFDYQNGVSIICVTKDRKKAEQRMAEEIENEKRESWIADIDPEDISTDQSKMYVLDETDSSWSVYLNGCYSTQHTDFCIHTVIADEL